MSTLKFVVSHLDEQLGPYDEQHLKTMWQKGEILPIDYVYDESKQDWILVSERFVWATEQRKTPPPATALTGDVMPPPPVKLEAAGRRLKEDLTTKISIPVAPVAAAPAAVATPKAVPAPISLGQPLPAAVPAAVAPVPVAKMSDAHLNLVDGVGEIDLSALHPGTVQLVLQDQTKMAGQTPLSIQVKPAEPVAVQWSITNSQVVGQDLQISIQAVDQNGKVCLAYNDQFTLKIAADSNPAEVVVKTVDGQGRVVLHHERAEPWSLELSYAGAKKLRLPEQHNLEWLAGPAARLMIDGSQEYVAGQPIKVQVKAVDAFGNVAKHFKGTVVLEVKAS